MIKEGTLKKIKGISESEIIKQITSHGSSRIVYSVLVLGHE